jgi:CRISPR-associated protein Cas1
VKKLLNTLYVTTPDAYLSLDGENIVVRRDEAELTRVPLHNLEAVVTFGYTGASPALMAACATRGVALTFLSKSGRFLASIAGEMQGNVLLRKTQYRISDSEPDSLKIARNMLAAKLHNSRWVLDRATRDHELVINAKGIRAAAEQIANAIPLVRETLDLEALRGIEGEAASRYFSVFDELILRDKDSFSFVSRNRRPPMDNVNAMLSLTYTLLANDCAAALSTVGLDPYIGFLHRDRPGRKSLALDLMEELRAPLADRFVLRLINNRQMDASDFYTKENGAVMLKDDARRKFLSAWQTRKQEELKHPYLGGKISWGLVPHAQALLLARYLRADLDGYPPFMWK